MNTERAIAECKKILDRFDPVQFPESGGLHPTRSEALRHASWMLANNRGAEALTFVQAVLWVHGLASFDQLQQMMERNVVGPPMTNDASQGVVTIPGWAVITGFTDGPPNFTPVDPGAEITKVEDPVTFTVPTDTSQDYQGEGGSSGGGGASADFSAPESFSSDAANGPGEGL